MSLKIRTIGNPDLIGDIQPGWSIDENATPHAIGDGSASVGGVQFSAGRRDDSEFLLNKPVTVYYEAEGTVATGNNVTGVFDSVDTSGASVSATSTNLFSRLTANVNAAPTYIGVDMGSKVYNPVVENVGITGQVFAMTRDSRGNYYIANGFPVNTIVQYSSDGNYTGLIIGGNNGPNPLANIVSMAYDQGREIIYAASNSGRVIGYSLSGDTYASFSTNDRISNLASIGVAVNGDLLLAGRAPNPAILRYTNQGSYLTQYGSSGTGNNQYSGIRSIDTDSAGNIYVLDENQTTFTSRVQKLNPAGTYLTQWAVPANYSSAKLSVEPSGAVYVIGTGASGSGFRGTKYSTAGTPLLTFSATSTLPRANAVYANSSGVYVVGSDTDGGIINGYSVVSYSVSGAEVSRFNTGLPSQSTFFGGRGMAVANGYIYISDRRAGRIARYTQDAVFVSSHDAPGIDSLDSDTSGNIYGYSRTSNPSGYTIAKYDKNITFISSWFAPDGTAAGSLSSAQDFKVAPNGDIYILESNNNTGSTFSRVSVFNNTGSYLRSFGSYGSGTGQFTNASSITVDNSYNTYVRSNSVVKYNVSGVQTLRFSASGNNVSGVGSAISVSENGIYITGTGSQTVDYYSPTGVLRQAYSRFGRNDFSSPAALFVGDGRITVYNAGTGDIFQTMSETPYLKTAFDYYVGLVGGFPLAFSGTNPPVSYPGWNDSLWAKLNELCAATGKEIVLQNDSIIVRDVASATIALDNFVGSPQRSAEKGSGRHIEIVNQNTSVVSGSPVFDYTFDAGRAISADLNEYNVTNVRLNTWLTSIQPPTPVDGVIGIYTPPGTYMVFSQENFPVPANTWKQYGGSFSATIGADGQSIDFAMRGPSVPIGGYTAPFSISAVLGGSKVTGVSVLGSGVMTNPIPVTVATGADWSIVTQDIAQTINQPFITSLGVLFDRAEFACAASNGGGQALDITVPTSDIGGLGLTAGSMFQYGKTVWRVRSSKIGNATINIKADSLTSVGQHDSVVPGETIGQHDARLAALTLGDSALKPLY